MTGSGGSSGDASGAPPPVDVDSRGQRCPLPVIALARALSETPAGATVRLLATDPAARVDVPAFCRLRGAELVGVGDERDADGEYTAYLVRFVSASAPEAELEPPPRASPGTPDEGPP